ncbi:c-type cytochrome domain-containing protein [Tundrisphaera lichenicola]|uniref:WD40 domain-containing protein n=1 Tax=Tundrisphaera lichenicola TaxID=2029860 RepID=UPI003EBDB011
MNRVRPILATLLLASFVANPDARADDPAPVSFLKDVAPILVQNCIACHNLKKSESKYVMTTFAQLAKGGAMGKDITLAPGDPDASYFVELCRPDGEPRMPYKQDPLPKEKLDLIERWVKEGAKYDGAEPTEDWPAALRKATPVSIPEAYPATVPITALAFSPDGSEVLTSGFHEVTTWKVADGSPARRLRGPAERIHDVAYSPDGKWMATASGDPGQFGSVQLWIAEPEGGAKLVRDLLETTDSAFAVAFSPDGTKLAAAGADRAVRVWEVATGKELALIEDHADWIFDLAWSPDGKRLATASRDKTSKVFDVEKKESIATFPGHADTVYCVAFAPDGKSIVTGGADNQIRSWNPDEDAKQIKVVGGFGGAVFRLLFAPDGKTLLATGADKVVRTFVDLAPKLTINGHNDWVYSLALSPDAKTIASGSWDGEVRLWSAEDGKPVRTILAAPGYKPEANAQAAAR